jgi:hypothetical protein
VLAGPAKRAQYSAAVRCRANRTSGHQSRKCAARSRTGGVHRLQIAPHGGRRVAVPENPLDVEQVEVVTPIAAGRVVQDASGGAAKIVRGNMAEAGFLRPAGDGPPNRALASTVPPVQSAGSSVAGGAGTLSTDQGGCWADIRIGRQVAIEGRDEGGASSGVAGLAPLARPRDGRQLPQIGDVERLYLRQAQPEKPETNDDLVPETDRRPVRAARDEPAVRLVIRQPAARILGLDLPVGAAVGAKRSVDASQMIGGAGLDDPLPDAPAEEGPNPRTALVDGVVGRITARAGRDEVRLGQLGGMAAAGLPEQLPERAPVRLSRPEVRVTTREPVDDARQIRTSRRRWPDICGLERPSYTLEGFRFSLIFAALPVRSRR